MNENVRERSNVPLVMSAVGSARTVGSSASGPPSSFVLYVMLCRRMHCRYWPAAGMRSMRTPHARSTIYKTTRMARTAHHIAALGFGSVRALSSVWKLDPSPRAARLSPSALHHSHTPSRPARAHEPRGRSRHLPPTRPPPPAPRPPPSARRPPPPRPRLPCRRRPCSPPSSSAAASSGWRPPPCARPWRPPSPP